MTRIILFSFFIIFIIGNPGYTQVFNDDEESDSYIIAFGYSRAAAPETFKINWESGFHFMAGIGFAVSPSVDVIPKFEYHRLGFNQREYRADPLVLNLFGVDLRPMAVMRGTGRMFLVGGLGISRTEIPDIIGDGELAAAGDMQMNLYINFGGGLEFILRDGLWIYIQVRYLDIAGVDIFNEDMTLYPFTLGIRF